MYDGYSALSIEYTCAFDGETIAEQCDDGITLNIHQVILPNQIKKFPVATLGGRQGNRRWVRKKALLALIENFSK